MKAKFTFVVSRMPGFDRVGDVWSRYHIDLDHITKNSHAAHRMAQKQADFGGPKPANVLVLKKTSRKGWRVSAIYESYIWAE